MSTTEEKKPPKVVHDTDYLAAFALFLAAHRHAQEAQRYNEMLAKLMGYDGPYAGCVTDAVWETSDKEPPVTLFNRALKNEGFTFNIPTDLTRIGALAAHTAEKPKQKKRGKK